MDRDQSLSMLTWKHSMKKLDQLQAGDILVLAGSIPSSMPASTYEDVLARLQDRKILTVVDATKNLLTNVLKYHPFLIKPNNHELGELFCLEFNTHEEVIPYAKELQKQGAQKRSGFYGRKRCSSRSRKWRSLYF